MRTDGNLEFLDVLNIVSLVVGILNYQETLTQSDKQDLLGEVDTKTKLVIQEIQSHLNEQDKLLREIRGSKCEKDSAPCRPD